MLVKSNEVTPCIIQPIHQVDAPALEIESELQTEIPPWSDPRPRPGVALTLEHTIGHRPPRFQSPALSLPVSKILLKEKHLWALRPGRTGNAYGQERCGQERGTTDLRAISKEEP